MPDTGLHFDGARVLADLHALRSIGGLRTEDYCHPTP
jgi:hypothetical protein